MQFKAQKKLLLSHLQPLAKVTPVRSTMPILSSILFDLKEGELTIQSSDIEITMISKLDVEGIRDGSVAIPSTVLLSLLNEFEDGEIEFIISEDYEVTLITSRGKYSLMGRPGEEFPSIPKVTEINTISIANEVLYRMIKKTLFACGKDELKPALLGVLFEFLKNEIRAVSTDSHRLVYIRREDFYTEGYEGKIIIPQKFLTILLGYLDKEGETVVTLGDNHVKVKLGSTVIYSRLIDEQFPDYEQVIPVANDHVVVGDIKELTSALKRSVVLSDRTTHQISITFDPDVSKIDSVDSETRSSSDEKIHLQYDGEQLEIGYNAYYLIDLLKNVETDEVIFKFRDSKGPSLILPSDQKENEEITMLLMPIMLNN